MEVLEMTEPAPQGQLYELRIIASGEVRDADGNLISQPVAEQTLTVTEQQALAMMQRRMQ
jgi:hypothetical protein